MTPESKAQFSSSEDLRGDEREILNFWKASTTRQWRSIHANGHSYLVLDDNLVHESDNDDFTLEQNEGVILYNHGGVDSSNGLEEFQANLNFIVEAQVMVPTMAMRLVALRSLTRRMAQKVLASPLKDDFQMLLMLKSADEFLGRPVAATIEAE